MGMTNDSRRILPIHYSYLFWGFGNRVGVAFVYILFVVDTINWLQWLEMATPGRVRRAAARHWHTCARPHRCARPPRTPHGEHRRTRTRIPARLTHVPSITVLDTCKYGRYDAKIISTILYSRFRLDLEWDYVIKQYTKLRYTTGETVEIRSRITRCPVLCKFVAVMWRESYTMPALATSFQNLFKILDVGALRARNDRRRRSEAKSSSWRLLCETRNGVYINKTDFIWYNAEKL